MKSYLLYALICEAIIIKMYTHLKSYFLIKTKTSTERILIHDIYCVEANNRKVTLYTEQANIEYYARLNDLETVLGEDFFRCHRGYLVNLRYVRKYTATEISLEC